MWSSKGNFLTGLIIKSNDLLSMFSNKFNDLTDEDL
jgi:hypothetical protein